MATADDFPFSEPLLEEYMGVPVPNEVWREIMHEFEDALVRTLEPPTPDYAEREKN